VPYWAKRPYTILRKTLLIEMPDGDRILFTEDEKTKKLNLRQKLTRSLSIEEDSVFFVL